MCHDCLNPLCFCPVLPATVSNDISLRQICKLPQAASHSGTTPCAYQYHGSNNGPSCFVPVTSTIAPWSYIRCLYSWIWFLGWEVDIPMVLYSWYVFTNAKQSGLDNQCRNYDVFPIPIQYPPRHLRYSISPCIFSPYHITHQTYDCNKRPHFTTASIQITSVAGEQSFSPSKESTYSVCPHSCFTLTVGYTTAKTIFVFPLIFIRAFHVCKLSFIPFFDSITSCALLCAAIHVNGYTFDIVEYKFLIHPEPGGRCISCKASEP